MTPAPADAPLQDVPARVLALCFWRSLFLQAGWNKRGMQNLGFAYAIDPALRALYPDPARHAAALGRHLGFFNCHPYMAAGILGGAIHHERRVAAGLEGAAKPTQYKATLQGPLAALGDGFFWTALRPFFGALAAFGALLVGWQAVVASVLLYNVVHLGLRISLFRAGFREGDLVVSSLARLSLPAAADRLRSAGAALCGISAAAVASRSGSAGALAAPVAVLAAAVGYAALARGARVLPTAYVAILAGAVAALVFQRFQGSR